MVQPELVFHVQHQHSRQEHIPDEQEEVRLVVSSDALPNPRTVVVHLVDARAASRAVRCLLWFVAFAGITVRAR